MKKERVAIESADVESKPPAPWKGRRAGSGGGRTAQIIRRSRNAIVKIARNPVTAWRMLWPRYGPFAAKAPDAEFRRVIRWSFGSLKRELLNEVFPGIAHTDVHVVRSYDREPLLSMTPSEILAIGAMVRFLRPKRLLEIGTFEGNTTVNLASNAPSTAHVFTFLMAGVGVTGFPSCEQDHPTLGSALLPPWLGSALRVGRSGYPLQRRHRKPYR